ncbi:fatty acid desaturase [soil metagenome]
MDKDNEAAGLSLIDDASDFTRMPPGATRPSSEDARRIEWPTLLVAIAIYGAWIALTLAHASVPTPLLAVLGGGIIAWHGSLQHETIHGHPTGYGWIDRALGYGPLSLWLPYPIYCRSHLAHHGTQSITDPLADPESHYLARPGGWAYRLAQLESPLLGRLVLGPPIRILLFAMEAGRQIRVEPLRFARDWIPHLLAVALILWWLGRVGLPLGIYVLAFIYPGMAITLLRSFAEHRADADPARRAAIIERPGPLGLLFLNNNLHAVHHARPDLPWYRLPLHFRAHRGAFAGPQSAPVYRSYGDIIRRFAWRAQDGIVHPDYRRQPDPAA